MSKKKDMSKKNNVIYLNKYKEKDIINNKNINLNLEDTDSLVFELINREKNIIVNYQNIKTEIIIVRVLYTCKFCYMSRHLNK